MAPTVGANAARKALPSESFGYISATLELHLVVFWTRCHIGTNVPTNCGMPKKNIELYVGPVPVARALGGDRSRRRSRPTTPPTGTTVDRQGILYCSHVVATGIVVSGAELVKIRSTPELISSWVTWTATLPSDCVSFSVISILYLRLADRDALGEVARLANLG